MPERVPPGRAGRLWLRTRLTTARTSAELLDRKRVLMRAELQRLESERDQAALVWSTTYAEAERWGVRVAAFGESDVALTGAALSGRTQVEVPWHNTMGVIHPGTPRCVPARAGNFATAAGNAAVSPASAAYERALESACALAAAETSVHLVAADLRATERQLRAIEHVRIPELETALGHLELRLDELEREERVVTRWAKRQRDESTGRTSDMQSSPTTPHLAASKQR